MIILSTKYFQIESRAQLVYNIPKTEQEELREVTLSNHRKEFMEFLVIKLNIFLMINYA